jgi:predicted MFS family arabinose efflux permease
MLTFLPEMAAGFGALAPVSVAGWTVGPGRYVYAGLLAAGVGGQYVGGRLVDRLPVELGLVGAFALLAVVGVLFAAAGGIGPVLLLGGLLGVALFAAQPLYQAAVAKHAAGGTRGLSYGYTYAGVFGVGALGGALAGAVLRYASPAALFGVLAVVAVLGAAVALETWR